MNDAIEKRRRSRSVTVKVRINMLSNRTSPTEATTRTGIPMKLIWLPYTIFSLIVVALMVASFVSYHKKNGHKYRRRRQALLKNFSLQTLVENIHQVRRNTPNFNRPPPCLPVNHTAEPLLSADFQGSSTFLSVSNVIVLIHHALSFLLLTGRDVVVQQVEKKRKKKEKRVEYLSNSNGSMIDLSLQKDIAATFGTKRAHIRPKQTAIWTLHNVHK
ncbi:unnamed protein product [Dimorphilus gyrociliatus]|uniref:Uncharacterized protein n=1 Tax=Dimorphilus gyrociliatus TaxID=2664684 RepID=A0A7I8VA44_9ANNE|nr:unnamed protein product [Dimorphilus gyrociliatus]